MSSPNLQNIPIKSDLGREIRKAFTPQIEIGPDYIVETLDVPSALADKMKTIPRRFNETLTAWADRCKATPCPQAEFGDRTNHDPS